MKYPNAFAALLGLVALTATVAPAQATEKANWTATVNVNGDGTHVLGNPGAKVKVDEFISYTCEHCASFHTEADAPKRLAYVQPGKVSVRIVHFVRDPVDLAVALAAHCGGPAGFFARHNMFLATHDKWMAKVRKTKESQRNRWTTGDMPSRMRAIASDIDLYGMMAPKGYDRAAVDRCLSDTALANRISAQRAEGERLGVPGTPSFAIGGVEVKNAHNWQSLKSAIDSQL